MTHRDACAHLERMKMVTLTFVMLPLCALFPAVMTGLSGSPGTVFQNSQDGRLPVCLLHGDDLHVRALVVWTGTTLNVSGAGSLERAFQAAGPVGRLAACAEDGLHLALTGFRAFTGLDDAEPDGAALADGELEDIVGGEGPTPDLTPSVKPRPAPTALPG